MNLPVLDVAIGISFVFLLLSLICTTVNEMLAGVLKSRAAFLDKGITRLLGGNEEIKKLFYKHPLIQSLAFVCEPKTLSMLESQSMVVSCSDGLPIAILPLHFGFTTSS